MLTADWVFRGPAPFTPKTSTPPAAGLPKLPEVELPKPPAVSVPKLPEEVKDAAKDTLQAAKAAPAAVQGAASDAAQKASGTTDAKPFSFLGGARTAQQRLLNWYEL